MVIYTIVTAILCLVALLVSETGVKDLNFEIIRKTIKKIKQKFCYLTVLVS